MKTKTIIPLVSLALGIVWIVYGLSHYGFWHHVKGPLAGFVPTILAFVLVAVSIIGLIQSFKEKEEPDRLESWTIVLASGIIFFLVFIFGMIISLMVFVLVWTKFYEKSSWKDTIIVLIISFGIIYGVFTVWLMVPFPNGIIIDAILG